MKSSPIAVLFITFNRPESTRRVFYCIKEVRPEKLFIAADGPRFGNKEDQVRCEEVRKIVRSVDWKCETKTLFCEENLGCKRAVSGAIEWFFNNVDEGIILEDDCIPNSSFFYFCEELLIKYRDNNRIMHISGTNLVPQLDSVESFIFSKVFPIWGWATWSRAWRLYDITMKRWPEYKMKTDLYYFGKQRGMVQKTLDTFYSNSIDSWDGQWAFTCMVNNGLSIIPKVNLIRNIGFNEEATHTKSPSPVGKIPLAELDLPVKYPLLIKPNRNFDEEFLNFLYGKQDIMSRVIRMGKRIAQKLLSILKKYLYFYD